MKTLRRKPASIAKTRWASYAAAGAASALAGSNSAEAAIHYSGILNEKFPAYRNRSETFQLMGQPGRSLYFVHTYNPTYHFGEARLGVVGDFLVSFGGFSVGSSDRYVSKLSFGQNISSGPFWPYEFGFMAVGSTTGQWTDRGTGYVGFRFNSGAGLQYGWIRVTMAGPPQNGFLVTGYAYADPGEPIRAGQRSSAEQAPDEGSLGWLALGAAGLLAWRKSRSQKGNKLSSAGTDN